MGLSLSLPYYDDDDRGPHSLYGPRHDSWYTGLKPQHCPGVGLDGRLYSLPQLNLSTSSKKMLKDYFDNTWTLTEVLLGCLQGEEAFKVAPYHNLRHPMIFYYGHPAALYVNKLRVAGLLKSPINAYFETLFETGVDEMSWDDLSKNMMHWPSVEEVTEYRREVYNVITNLINNLSDESCHMIDINHPLWALVLAFEHERIHIETSSVLIAELPSKYVKFPTGMPPYHPSVPTTIIRDPIEGLHYPINNMIEVKSTKVSLGKSENFPSFGWDNEYGYREFDVSTFKASAYKVTNGQFLEFVRDGGYAKREYWSDDGWSWRAFRNSKWPVFWQCIGPQGLHHYDLRTTFDIIPMAWDWPVIVNFHEASAFCKWRSSTSGKTTRVMTELEHNAMRDEECEKTENNTNNSSNQMRFKYDPVLSSKTGVLAKDSAINTNLSYSSMSSVTTLPPNKKGFYDLHGNAWEWCSDYLCALPGFKVHPYYEDFSTPCFDGKHNVIMGASFISTGNEASVYSRFHFRPHFFQHAGFRIVESETDFMMTSDTDAPGPFTGHSYPFRRSAIGNETSRIEFNDLMDKKNRQSRLHQHYGKILLKNESYNSNNNNDSSNDNKGDLLSTLLMNLIIKQTNNMKLNLSKSNLLEIGCGPGGLCSQIGLKVHNYLGIDHDNNDILLAKSICLGNDMNSQLSPQIEYQGDGNIINIQKIISLELINEIKKNISNKNIQFKSADPACLPSELVNFDIVIINDILDQMISPNSLLGRLAGPRGVVRSGGLLIIISTFQWNELKTPKSLWFGGLKDKIDINTGQPETGITALSKRLIDDFSLLYTIPIQAVWQESVRDSHSRIYDALVFVRK